MRLHSQTSVRWPAAGLVAETLQATREGFGPNWLSWSVDPATSKVTMTGPDGAPEVLPIRVTSGEVARPGSAYVVDVEGLTVTRVAATLSGSGADGGAARADVAVDYPTPGRGRAVASASLVSPYGFTSRSDVRELQWDVTASDGRRATVRADVRLLWAVATADLAVDADHSTMAISVDFGPTGVWKPLLGPILWFLRKRIAAGFDAWCTEVTQSINHGVPEELASIRAAAQSPDAGAGDSGPNDLGPPDPSPIPPPDLDPWVDLTWLRSPITVVRHVLRQAKR